MRRRSRRLLAGALLVVLVILAGCATGGTEPDRPAPAEDGRPTGLVTRPPDGTAVSPIPFGAAPDDDADDRAGLQAALSALSPGETLLLPPGRYLHDDVLVATVPDTTVTGPGAVLVATDEASSALVLDANRVTVRDLSLTVNSTTRRWDQPEQHKIVLGPRREIVLSGVTVGGSAASGIFVDGTASFLLDQVQVRNTRADGVHITSGARDGRVDGANVSNTGDDGIAVVSYMGQPPSRDIAVTGARVSGNTHGRGLSVVGGEAIRWTDVEVRDSAAAALYIAVEDGGLATTDTSGVTVDGARIIGANTDTGVDHGAVLIYSGRSGAGVTDVVMDNIEITDTRADSSRQVALLSDGGSVSGVVLRDFAITGGPARRFETDLPPDAYEMTGW